jgi:hypothetical protein
MFWEYLPLNYTTMHYKKQAEKSFSFMVRHLEGDLQGQFHETLVYPVFIPGALVDQLLHPVLPNGVDIGLLLIHHGFKLGPGRLRVAVEEVPADQFPSAVLGEGGNGLIVHVKDDPFLVANGDRSAKSFYPISGHDY